MAACLEKRRSFLFQNMLTREQKKKIVQDLTQDLQNSKGVVFSTFQGLSAKNIQELRTVLKKEKVVYKVVKLTLLKRALKSAGIDAEKFDVHLPLSVSSSREDEVIAAKALNNFAKAHQELKIVAGILEKQLLLSQEVKALAQLPGKQELRAQVVGAIASPLRGLVGVLSGNMRGLLNVLNAKLKIIN